MLYGRLVNGRLSDIAQREKVFPEDVVLATMPPGRGPWGYDAVGQQAIPLAVASQTTDEKVEALGGLAQKVLAALAIRLSTSWATLPMAQRTAVQGLLDGAATRILSAF